jgi:predicted nuclease with TOPRIM domain
LASTEKQLKKGGIAMEVTEYCNKMSAELTGWKARMYDVAKKVDNLETGEREKIFNEVNEIHMIIEELSDRIHRLKTECPTEWSPDEIEMNAKSSTLKLKLEEVSNSMGVLPSDQGG